MQVLLVEDDPTHARVLQDGFGDIGGLVITVAASRDAAFEALVQPFDLVVCDMKIPSRDGVVDHDLAHGIGVLAEISQKWPGVPVLIHSAVADIEHVKGFYERSPRADYLGSGDDQLMVSFLRKGDLLDCVEKVRQHADSVRFLDEVIEVAAPDIDLEPSERRALALFGRRHNGRIVRVRSLGGGYSSSKVLHVTVIDEAGGMRALSVAKVASLNEVHDEHRRYQDCVVSLLGAGTNVGRVDEVCAGAGGTGAVFYQLAGDYERSLFDVARDGDAEAAQVVRSLKEICRQWHDGAPQRTLTVREVRTGFVDDADMENAVGYLAGIEWEELERRTLNVRWCCQHGDLHGENVLVLRELRPLVIDFGEVRRAAAALDPVVLELSLVFHPKGREICGVWPSENALAEWQNIDKYLIGCPYPEFVRACREWAGSVTDGERAVYANVYGHAVRQLKYDDVSKDAVRTLIAAVTSAFLRT